MALLTPALLPADSFTDVQTTSPDEARIEAEYDRVDAQFDRAQTLQEWLNSVRSWDDVRRELHTWSSMVELQFQQNTKDPIFKNHVDRLNDLHPKIQTRDVAIKRRLLASPRREELERDLGTYAFQRWESNVAAFDPRIEEDVIAEAKLCDDYTALLAGALIPFEDEHYTLPGLGKFSEHPDRAKREAAARAKWAFFEEHRSELESLFDKLVHVRDKMARALGYENYVELGYKRMLRTDYNAADVARYREEIQREIVPLCKKHIIAEQQQRIGIDPLRIWDEGVFYADGNPKPPAEYGAMIRAAQETFTAMDPALAKFASLMIDGSLLDLQLRDGKAGGGFCTSFPVYGLPYIFANFNGTTHDVNVLVHEMGHAFQCYESRDKALSDYLWPTLDACEIHSMSMEFLTWPQLERFFGKDAERYRIQHLAITLLFLPYGAAVDHFQHLVYENPNATPDERNGFWKELQAKYLPWRNGDTIPYIERGGMWQQQRHIYCAPFYYIDYTLAANCALQFWIRSLDDYQDALADYTAFCKRGGEAPFQTLVRSAGLRSPFEPGVFAAIASRAKEILAL